MVRDHGGSLTERFKVSAEGNVWAGGENINEAGLGYDMDTAGHEGIGMYHDGSTGYIKCVDSGTAWQTIVYDANGHTFKVASGTKLTVTSTAVTSSLLFTAAGVRVNADPGSGAASINTFTNATSGTAGGSVTVQNRTGGGTAHAGYIKIYVGTTARYLATFS
jgi:hypothetical protein